MSHDDKSKSKKPLKEEHLDATTGLPHHFEKAHDGGSCVWRGIYKYYVHSCSYRYQALGRALDDLKVYDWPAYKAAADKGQAVETSYDAQKDYPRWYRSELEVPKKNEWDVKGRNFKGSLKPYWNQAHHIIPVGSLENSLQQVAEGLAKTRQKEGKERLTSSSDILFYLKGSLLKSKYNINHKKNMIILPMDNAVADILRMPKHGGPDSNNHVEYSRLMKDELDKIMDNYRSCFCDLPDKEHISEEDRELQKARLEALSEDFYEMLTRDCPRGTSPSETSYSGGKSLESEAPRWRSERKGS
jgi:hypothetical protein